MNDLEMAKEYCKFMRTIEPMPWFDDLARKLYAMDQHERFKPRCQALLIREARYYITGQSVVSQGLQHEVNEILADAVEEYVLKRPYQRTIMPPIDIKQPKRSEKRKPKQTERIESINPYEIAHDIRKIADSIEERYGYNRCRPADLRDYMYRDEYYDYVPEW